MIKLFLVFTLCFSSQAYSQSKVNSDSKKADKQATMSGVISVSLGTTMTVVGGVMLSTCTAKLGADCAPAYLMIAMGLASLAQGGVQMTAAKKSQASAMGSSFSGLDFKGNDFQMDLPDGTKFSAQDLQNKYNSGLSNLTKNGANYDKKTNTLTMPDGTSVALGGLSGSASGMASQLGISEKSAQKILDELNKAKDKANAMAKNAKVTFPGLTGSSGVSASAGGSFAPREPSSTLNDFLGGNRKIASPKTAGLSKNFNGQPVGIAQDNIFQMINRKYEMKKMESFFVNDSDEDFY